MSRVTLIAIGLCVCFVSSAQAQFAQSAEASTLSGIDLAASESPEQPQGAAPKSAASKVNADDKAPLVRTTIRVVDVSLSKLRTAKVELTDPATGRRRRVLGRGCSQSNFESIARQAQPHVFHATIDSLQQMKVLSLLASQEVSVRSGEAAELNVTIDREVAGPDPAKAETHPGTLKLFARPHVGPDGAIRVGVCCCANEFRTTGVEKLGNKKMRLARFNVRMESREIEDGRTLVFAPWESSSSRDDRPRDPAQRPAAEEPPSDSTVRGAETVLLVLVTARTTK